MGKIMTEIEEQKNEKEMREFVDFTIINEAWDLHKLSDKSILRARVLLTGVMLDGKIEEIESILKSSDKPLLGMTFRTKNVFEVEPPINLRGLPDNKQYSNEELRACITEKDIDFETIKQSWNIYELKNGIRLKLRMSIVTVHKTNKLDARGMPIYLMESSIELKTELPESLEKILAEKKSKQAHESTTFKPIS